MTAVTLSGEKSGEVEDEELPIEISVTSGEGDSVLVGVEEQVCVVVIAAVPRLEMACKPLAIEHRR